MWRLQSCCLAVVVCFAGFSQSARGQMVTTQMPLQTNSTSFYEQSHVAWGIQNPHYFINFNGGGVVPPFGGYQPNAGLHTGFAVGNAHFDLGFAQGAMINSTMASPVLTTTSGYPGMIFMGSQSPFVTGVVPQVGAAGFASVPSDPITSRMAAGEFRIENRKIVPGTVPVEKRADAGRLPRPAVAVAPGPKPAASTGSSRDQTAAQCMERATAAEKEGKNGVAKIYYQLAAAKGDPTIKALAAERLDALKAVPTAKP